MRTMFVSGGALGCLVVADVVPPVLADHRSAAVIEQSPGDALPESTQGGTVLEQEGALLREGDSDWTRRLPPTHLQETPPMCDAAGWMEGADAYLRMKDFTGAPPGVCYMLAGDEGASNIDPLRRSAVKVIVRREASG